MGRYIQIGTALAPRCVLVSVMAVYYVAFMGVESSLRQFTPAFAVSSRLQLSRAEVPAIQRTFV